MANLEGPLEIKVPGLGEQITEVVHLFAEQQGIQHEAWYHDEPLWFISKQEGSLVWSVQVAAFGTGSSRVGAKDELFFIPDVCVLDEDKLEEVALAPGLAEKYTYSISMSDLSAMDKEARTSKLSEILSRTWQNVIKLGEGDITHKLGKIPSRA
jgi:hypothetical protein